MFLYTVDGNRVRQIAHLRGLGKSNLSSHAPLTTGFDELGVMGELAFEIFSGQPIDDSRHMDGDKGIDFSYNLTIDVKTSRKPGHLLVPTDKVHSNIYILAKADPDLNNKVELIGWEWGKIVQKAPIDDGVKFKNPNNRQTKCHYIPATELRHMDKLRSLLYLLS